MNQTLPKKNKTYNLYPYFIYFLLLILLHITLVKNGFPNFANDPGLGWHLKTGEYIYLNQTIPQIDPFLAGYQRNWISDQWLSDYILYNLQINLGWQTSYLVLMFLFLFPYLYILLNFSNKATALATAFAVFICVRMSAIHFIFRPVIFSFFCFSLIYYFLLKSVKKANFSKLEMAIIPTIFLLWCNLHPSFILGIVLLGLLLLTVVICKFSKEEDKFKVDSNYTNQVLILILASFLMTLINPYGYQLHESILKLGSSKFFMNLNNEWKPIDFNSYESNYLIFTVMVIIFWFFKFQRQSLKIYFMTFSCLFFAFQSLGSVRFLPYYSLCLLPLLSKAFSDIHKTHFIFLIDSFTKKEGRVFLGSFLALILVSYFFNYLPFSKQTEFGIPKIGLILESIRKNTKSQPAIIYNHPNIGGVLTYYCNNLCKPLLDDRNTLLGEEIYKEYLNLNSWDDALKISDKYRADFILVPNKKRILVDLDADQKPSDSYQKFQKIFSDQENTLFKRIF